jgi:hypothetical protein
VPMHRPANRWRWSPVLTDSCDIGFVPCALSMSPCGPKPKCRNVRDLVANGWKADTTRTSQK